jgi:Ran GTPase-activating protein (RanGAP) involved in mRNA processing and transport
MSRLTLDLAKPAFTGNLQNLITALENNADVTDLELTVRAYYGAQLQTIADAVNSLKQLTHICLSDAWNGVGGPSMEILPMVLFAGNRIRRLDLSHCREVGRQMPALCDALLHATALEELDLSNCSITNFGVNKLLSTLSETTTPQGLSECNHIYTSLRTLNLAGNDYDDAGAITIAEYLKTDSRLRCIDVEGWNVTYAGAQQVLNALIPNTTLTHVRIGNCKLSVCARYATHQISLGLLEDSAERVSEAIVINCSLCSLAIKASGLWCVLRI